MKRLIKKSAESYLYEHSYKDIINSFFNVANKVFLSYNNIEFLEEYKNIYESDDSYKEEELNRLIVEEFLLEIDYDLSLTINDLKNEGYDIEVTQDNINQVKEVIKSYDSYKDKTPYSVLNDKIQESIKKYL